MDVYIATAAGLPNGTLLAACLLYTSRKIAVVQGYTARASKSSQSVEAFGESEPVATIEGQRKYTLELTRLYACLLYTSGRPDPGDHRPHPGEPGAPPQAGADAGSLL